MTDQRWEVQPGADLDWISSVPLPLDEIRALFVALEKALRARRLYEETNPARQRFVKNLREGFQELWTKLNRLVLSVEASALTAEGQPVYESEDQASSLAFLMYKDGLREISLLQGIEAQELEAFLDILNRAQDTGPSGDDLLNLLWDADLECVEYQWVNLLSEGVELPEPGMGAPPQTLEEMAEEGGSVPASGEAEEAAPMPLIPLEGVGLEKFDLDQRDMDHFREEIELEMSRDLHAGVLAALLDRFEDPQFPEQRPEIVEIFHTLLPNLLARNEFGGAGQILEVLREAESAAKDLDESLREDVAGLLDEVSAPETLDVLFAALDEGGIESPAEELGLFLSQLRVGALRPLLKACGAATDQDLPPVVQEGVAALARRNEDLLLKLASDQEVEVVRGAIGFIAALKVDGAAPILAKLSSHSDPAVRVAAIEAGIDLRSSILAEALEPRLHDEVREVRLAAVRALAGLGYRPAAPWLKSIITDRDVRSADVQEQIALFETFGMLAGEEEVPTLEKLLVSSGWFRSQPKEIRAAAALALGKMPFPAAQEVLRKAAATKDPVVRNAVGRALSAGAER